MSEFAWATLIKAGLQGLGLTPEQFWRLTPGELRVMLGQGGSSAALTRTGLDALLAAYPDEERGEIDE